MKTSLIALALLGALNASATVSSKLVHRVDQCGSVASAKTIYLVKQWHVAPTTDTTKIDASKKLPQFENQSEIYSAIAQMVEKKEIDTAIAEGCEGVMDSKFKDAFNGWTFESLSKESTDKKYNSILTHVLLKAEAKYPEELKVLCGDDYAQIKISQLALSDLRGDVGYWQRITENEKNPTKLKTYLDGVIDTFKLPATTDSKTALEVLKKDIADSFTKFTNTNKERDLAVVKAIKAATTSKPILVVYGGLHAEDLKAKFEAEKWNCEIYEPKSYKNNEEALLEDFKKITK